MADLRLPLPYSKKLSNRSTIFSQKKYIKELDKTLLKNTLKPLKLSVKRVASINKLTNSSHSASRGLLKDLLGKKATHSGSSKKLSAAKSSAQLFMLPQIQFVEKESDIKKGFNSIKVNNFNGYFSSVRKRSKASALSKYFIIEKLRSYLPFKDYLSFLLTSKRIYNLQHIKRKLQDILIQGITQQQRIKYWSYKCSIQKNYKSQYHSIKKVKCTYEMEKDIERTFDRSHPYHSLVNSKMKLQNILKAFAVKNPDIEYVQGLNFVAANLLVILRQEEVRF